MLNIQVDNGQLQSLNGEKVISVKSGDKIQVSVGEDSTYQVLIAENQVDVILQVKNSDGSTFDVVLEGLASLYEAGDVITQLLLDINGEEMVVSNIGDLLGALEATAAGGVIGQNRSFADDNPNIDPSRSAADDSDQLRSDIAPELLGVDTEGNERPSVSNVFLVENEILGVEAAGDLNIITGQLTATDPNVADTHTFSIVEGSLSVTDTNGVITLLGDSVTAVVNEDGTYTISGDFNDLSDGEIATVTFDYIATDQGGLSSIPATVSLEITGTNDIPVVEDINLNGELSASWLINASTTPQEIPDGEGPSLSSYDINGTSIENINALFYNGPGSVTLADLPDVNPYDGSAIKYSFNVNAGETITFSWIFNDAERPVEFTEFNDTAFVVIDGQQINVLAAVDDPGFTNSGLFTYTFPDAGTHEITFGVVNDNDDEVDSNLVVTYVTGGELTGTEIAGYVEALGASAVYFETFDTEDVLGVDDTQDEDTNFFTGLLSVADDDVMNEGLHTFHVVQDEENNNIVTVAGTTVVTADDIDVDIIQNEDGTWSYTIDGDFSALAAGETATVSFQYYADDTRGFDGSDGINESSISEPKTITVTITGTNDQPIVENVVRGVDEIIYENSDQDEEDTNQDGILRNDEGDMTVSGQLSASDEDVNDTHTFAQVEESVQSDNQLIDPEDLSVVVNSDGSYSMTGDFTALAAGETATVTFQYTATDSSSGNEENNTSEPKTVSITVTGTNDQPVVEAINANDILASGTETGQEITEEGSITGLWQEGSVHYTYFTVHETTTLSINANSLDFDTYLYLLRNDGDLSVDDFITSDDDGGLELNSYIHITLAPGEYVAAVGDYYLGLNEVISGINNENRSGDFTLTFNANHDITTHDTTMNNSVFYETHDATDIPGVDDTQEDVLTSFNSTLATATDDDVNDTHTYHKLGTETIDNELVTDFNVIVNEDGTYSISGNFNPLAAGETATVTFYYYANDGRGFDGTDGINESSISEPKAVTLTITGTNDQPIVQNVVMGVDETIYETHDENPWDNWTHVFPFYNPDMDGGIGLNDEYKNWIQGTLTASDEDVNDTHTFALADMMPVQAPNTQIVHNVNYDTNGVLWGGRGVVDVAFTSSAINASDVSIDAILLSSDNGTGNDTEFYLVGDFDALAAGETATITFKYYATDSSDFQTPGETNTSEYKTVSITVTGTNDQPVVDNVVMGLGDDIIYETHDENPWDDFTQTWPYFNWDDDAFIGLNDEHNNFITGTLSASDEDVNDTHTFALADMTPSLNPNTQIVQNVNYDTNGVFWGGKGTVDVAFTSSAINADDVKIEGIFLASDNGSDNDTNFALIGDFDALAAGETATITFKYYATDSSDFQTPGETNTSEYKTVSITVTGTNDQPVVDNVVMGLGDDIIYETHDENPWDDFTQTWPYFNWDDDAFIGLNDEHNNFITGILSASDEDVNDTHTFALADMTPSLNPNTQIVQNVNYDTNGYLWGGKGTVDVAFTSSAINADDIKIEGIFLASDNGSDNDTNFALIGDFDALAAGETATITFKYYATDSSDFQTPGETNTSEYKTVSITVTGTNDQPVVDNVVMGLGDDIIYETHDENPWDDFTQTWPYFNWDDDAFIGLNDEHNNFITGILSASDEDVNDTHTFALADMTPSLNPNTQIVQNVNYDTNGVFWGGKGTVDVAFTSSAINADDIKIEGIFLASDNGSDNDTNFALIGDFDALAAGETATITFKYYATDSSDFQTPGETNTSEYKTVSITVTGTNDQPVVDNVVMGLGDDIIYETHDENPWDDFTQTWPYFNWDDDAFIGLNDEHNNFITGTLSASDEDVNDTHTFALADMTPSLNPNTQIVQNVNYDTNGGFWGGKGTVDVAFTSSAINADDVKIEGIFLASDNGSDNDTNFALIGDFDALAAGETATITFKYYATDSSDFQTPGETNTSEYKTVSITVTGTNDQPVVDNVVMGLGDDIIYETHDENPWDDWTHVFPFYNPDMDGGIGLNDEYKNWIKGTLTASDDDVNDTHTFALADMMPTQAPNTQIVQNVNYDTNGVLWGGRGTVDVAFTSSAVNASDVTIDAILLSSDNGTDNDTEFYLVGDFNALASGETATVTFKYYATDSSVSQTQGETNTSEPKFVSITVTGTNDQPVVDNVVMGVDENIYESRDNKWYNNGEDDTQDDVTTAVFGKLTAMDDDLNDTHVFNVRDYTASDYYGHGNGGPGQHGDQGDIRFDDVEFFQKGPHHGSESVKMMIDSTDVEVGKIDVTKLVLFNNDAADSEVDFKLEGNFNALGVGETATVTFEYVANDKTGYGQSGDANNEPSLSEAKLVTITITGTNDQPVVTANKVYTVSEADGDLIPSVEEEETVIREAFEVQDDDVNDTHTFSIESIYNLGEIDMAGGYELFGPVTYIDALGNISAVFVQVKLPAGVDAKDISIDSIRVHGGEFEIRGSFDALSGEINGNPADVLDIKLKYFAEDQNGLDGTDGINESSRSETHWMNIKVEGTNDVASLGGDNTGNIHEDDTWTIDGQLTVTDLDAGEEAYQSTVTYDSVNSTNATALGVLIMDPSTSKWSYYLDHANNAAAIQALGDEQIVEKFIVKSIDGTEQTVTITIQGENDAPLITTVTGDDTTITENQVIDGNVTDATVLADVDASDVDSANLTYTITSGNSEGYFEINSDGEISLTALGESEIAASHVNDRIFDLGITVSDGSLEDTTTVTITVDDNFVNIPSVDLPASMDSGASNSDNITNVTLPTWQLANIAPDALNVIITDENSVIQAQAARSSVDGMWVISNAGAGELSFNGVNWFFTPDNALADGVYGYNAIVIDDAGNEASKAFNITIDTTPPVIDSDDIAADINETLSSINLGEIAANDLNGPVTFTVSGTGFSLDANNNLIFNGELDYESSSSQTATITATDVAGNSISQDVTVQVNNVTGIVSLLAGGVALQTFNCCNNEGWTGHGHEDYDPHGVLGWFEDDSDTRYQTFDLDANAGEDVTINFNLSVYGKQQWVSSWGGGYYKGSGWEGDDTFTVTVTDSNGDTITTENYSPDGNVTNMAVSFDITVPDDGEFTVKFQSANTVDSGAQVESWSVDNFEIVGADHQVLTFDSGSEGEIDMAALLDQGNDFEDEGGNSVTTPDSVDEIDLTSGDHILSNLSVEDFIAMTDDDNTLRIEGDSGDEIKLDMTQWQVASNDAIDAGNPDAGIDIDNDGYVTYTNIEGVGGLAEGSLQLLIDEDIDVNI